MAININDLAREINQYLSEYVEEVEEAVNKNAHEIAKKGAKKLKLVSPKLTGDYAKGWSVKKYKGASIIHNKTDWQLTHLLEKSHSLPDGGRSTPQPHIRPVEREVIAEFTESVRQAVQGD